MCESDHRARYETRFARVLDHIYDHLDEPLDIGWLAEIVRLPPYHWHRIYQAMCGETVTTTVRHLRLHRGADFLRMGGSLLLLVGMLLLLCAYTLRGLWLASPVL